MKNRFIALVLILTPWSVLAQSGTTQALQKRFSDSFSLYFYKNTLRMLNQTDNKEFDEIVKNIEKLKFLMVDKTSKNFSNADYKNLLNGYRKEAYEEILTTRYEGKNFDVYLKDKKGETLGTVILVNDSSNLYILDMLGTIDVTKATRLFSELDGSSDIGQRVKSFLNKDDKKEKKKESKDEDVQ